MSKNCGKFIDQDEEDLSGEDYFSEEYQNRILTETEQETKQKPNIKKINQKTILRDFFPDLTKSQLAKLSKYKFANGRRIFNFSTESGPNYMVLMEIIRKFNLFDGNVVDYQELDSFLSKIKTIEDIIEVQPDDIILRFRENIQSEIDISTESAPINPDFGQCPFCAMRTLRFAGSKQTRAADEATDEFYQCANKTCKNVGKQIKSTQIKNL